MRPRRFARVMVLGGILSMLAMSGASCSGDDPAEPPGPPRLLIIGLDGATWDIMDPLMEQGRLPNLQRLRETGVSAPLASLKPCVSPGLWTSIATGKLQGKHGIWGFRYLDDQGREAPINSTLRQAQSFWEILGEAGHNSCIVGWWNTWPATPMHGVLVSDYLYFARNTLDSAHPTELDQLLQRAAYPPSLAPLVVRELRRAERTAPSMVRSLIDYDDAGYDAFVQSVDPRIGVPRGDHLSVLKNKLIEMRFHRDLGLALLDSLHFDVHVYYSKGIDATGHMFWKYFEPHVAPHDRRPVDPANVALYGNVVPRFYELEDDNIEALLDRAGPETYVLVISDHGHDARAHNHAPDGIFMIQGPGVRKGIRGEGIGLVDLTPLILHLFDLPVGRDMDGSVPTGIFTEAHRKAHPVRFVDSHEKPREGKDLALDAGMQARLEEELRALGYIK